MTSRSAWWDIYTEVPMAVLVDMHTSSGAEILAAALQDHLRAIIIGDKTAGKCEIRRVYEVGDGRLIRFRTAIVYRPVGEKIDGNGVRPNQEVSVSESVQDAIYGKLAMISDDNFDEIAFDPYLKKAQETLLSGLR
jgi:C-terminal processing protease CtpA/Prc